MLQDIKAGLRIAFKVAQKVLKWLFDEKEREREKD